MQVPRYWNLHLQFHTMQIFWSLESLHQKLDPYALIFNLYFVEVESVWVIFPSQYTSFLMVILAFQITMRWLIPCDLICEFISCSFFQTLSIARFIMPVEHQNDMGTCSSNSQPLFWCSQMYLSIEVHWR